MARPRHPEEVLLRRVADAHPDPFIPKAFAHHSGIDLAVILSVLDRLHAQGLVERIRPEGENSAELMVGLTPLGLRTVSDPEALDRFAHERRQSLEVLEDLGRAATAQGRAWATGALLMAMAANFGLGGLLAWRSGLGSDYLFDANSPGMLTIYRSIGMFVPDPDLPGSWWRLLSAGFVHLGLVHLLVNAFSLNSLGRLSEGLWGVPGFLLIFLVSVWSGFALAGAVSPGPTGGASGGICGLLGAMGAWVAVNRGHMPPAYRRNWTRALFINAVLIGGMSLLPGISGLGHLGGALGGGATGLGLALMARGSGLWPRGAAVLLATLAAMGWLGRTGLENAARSESAGRIAEYQGALADRKEVPELNGRLVPAVANHFQRLKDNEELHWHPLLQRDKFRRNAMAAAEGARLAGQCQAEGEALMGEWKALALKGTVASKARSLALDMLSATTAYCQIVAGSLGAGRDWPMERDREIVERRGAARRGMKAWTEFLLANRGGEDDAAGP